MAPPKIETTETEVIGFALPGHVTTRMGESAVMVGYNFSNGMSMSGIVTRMVHIGGGTVRVFIGERSMLLFSTGGLAEEK
jgi:hypothetical protein